MEIPHKYRKYRERRTRARLFEAAPSCGSTTDEGTLPNGDKVGSPGVSKSPPGVLLDALAELAQASGHPEVAHAPSC